MRQKQIIMLLTGAYILSVFGPPKGGGEESKAMILGEENKKGKINKQGKKEKFKGKVHIKG